MIVVTVWHCFYENSLTLEFFSGVRLLGRSRPSPDPVSLFISGSTHYCIDKPALDCSITFGSYVIVDFYDVILDACIDMYD